MTSGVASSAFFLRNSAATVNALRQFAGLGAQTFTDNPLIAGTSIKAVHITELRAAVNAVRVLASFSSFPFTDPTITAGVTMAKAAHILELRSGIK